MHAEIAEDRKVAESKERSRNNCRMFLRESRAVAKHGPANTTDISRLILIFCQFASKFGFFQMRFAPFSSAAAIITAILLLSCVSIGKGQQPARSLPPISHPASLRHVIPLPPVVDTASHADPASLTGNTRPDLPETFHGPTGVDTLIGYALAHNPEIQAARYYAQSLRARVPQAESLPDPTLMTTVFLEEIQTAAGPQQLAVNLSQKFPWFGKRALKGQVACAEAMAAYRRVAVLELNVVEQVKRAYYDLHFAEQALHENRRLEGPLQEVIDVTKSRFETDSDSVGLETVYQTQIERTKLKIELVRLGKAKHIAQARLAATLQLPPQSQIEALDTIQTGSVATEADTLMQLAASCHPEYDAWQRELARDRAAIALAQRNRWPDLTASLNWYEMGGQGLSPVANGRDAFALGVGVNLPIYRTRLDAAVREATNKFCATSHRLAATRTQFQAEIETLHAEFQEHHSTLQILETEILPRAEETVRLTLQAYRADRAEYQQLMDVYRTLLRYRVDRHRHVARSAQAIASLERAVGCAVTSPATQ